MAADAGGWTLETLHAHLQVLQAANDKRYEQRFDAQQKALELGFSAQKAAVDAALAAADRAVQKAELAAEKRFEAVNEFRATLADQQRTLMPRSESEVAIKSINEKIEALEKKIDSLFSERAGVKGGYGYAVGIVGFVIAVAAVLAMVSAFFK